LNQLEESAGNKITAAALQDTDGSASHSQPIFFEKTLLRRLCHRFRKHLLQCPRLFFEKLAMAVGSFEK